MQGSVAGVQRGFQPRCRVNQANTYQFTRNMIAQGSPRHFQASEVVPKHRQTIRGPFGLHSIEDLSLVSAYLDREASLWRFSLATR